MYISHVGLRIACGNTSGILTVGPVQVLYKLLGSMYGHHIL